VKYASCTHSVGIVSSEKKKCNVHLDDSCAKSRKRLSLSSADDFPVLLVSRSEEKTLNSALMDGFQGAIGGLIQVITMMWLRTIVNYQYRYGTPLLESCRVLYRQGGLRRFYSGISFAIVQGPMSRFGSVAGNQVARSVFSSYGERMLSLQTAFGSLLASIWRVFILPLDTCKTVLQVEGYSGFQKLMEEVRMGNVSILYEGSLAAWLVSITAHFPWFYVYNMLQRHWPVPDRLRDKVLRSALIGFLASAVSDASSNSLRAVKTVKQAYMHANNGERIDYMGVLRLVLKEDGLFGLMGRGLLAKLISNGLQSMLFLITWDLIKNRGKDKID
jgi:hypothetical protein